MRERTCAIIKPDMVENVGVLTEIIARWIVMGDLKAIDMRRVEIRRAEVSLLYPNKVGEPWFEDMVRFFESGSSVALLLEGEDAIQKVRRLNEGIRRDFPPLLEVSNSVHGSDSRESAKREIQLFFPHYAPIPGS